MFILRKKAIRSKAFYCVDSVSLAMVMRKEGKIVFMENKFLDDLRPGSPIAFQFDRYSAWPEHDAVEFSAQAW